MAAPRAKQQGIYRRVGVRMWADAKVRSLSKPQPCGQVLWFHLLAGEQTDIIPGLCRIGEAAFAEQLGWPLEGFREAFAEVSSRGMVRADWEARLVWVPNAIHHNAPQSPNVIKSWADAWDRLPECGLKLAAWAALRDFAKDMGEAFAEAFAEACPKPSANQEQEQEQEIAAAARERVSCSGSATEGAGVDSPPAAPASSAPEALDPGTATPGLPSAGTDGGVTAPVPAAGGHGAEAAATNAGGEGTKAGPSLPAREPLRRVPDFAAMDSDLRPPPPPVVDVSEPGHDTVRAALEAELGKSLVPLQGQRKVTFDRQVRQVGQSVVLAACRQRIGDRRRGGEDTFAMASFFELVMELRRPKPDAPAGHPLVLKVRETLRAKVRPDLYARWFGGMRGRLNEGALELVAPDAFAQDFLESNYRPLLEGFAREAGHEGEVRIVVDEPQAAAGGVA